MPLSRPSLSELIGRAQADIEGRLPGADAKVRRTNLNVIGRVIAGLAHGLYGFLEIGVRQWFVDQADEENVNVHASMWLEKPIIAAEYAVGAVTLPGSNGAVLEAGAQFTRSDGVLYESTSAATVSGGVATVPLSAVEAGQAGNALPGVKLQLTKTAPGFDSTATVVGDGMTGGADVESAESRQKRVLERMRRTPMGGAAYDYIAWMKEVPGTTRMWVYPKEMGRGKVTVRFMRDNDPDPFPSSAVLDDMFAYLDERCNVGMEVIAVAPIANPVNYEIRLIPDTPAIRAAVEAELRDLHQREATPGGNYFDPEVMLMRQGGKLLVSHMREAISIAEGEVDHELLAPTEDVTSTTGHLPTFGGITWVE